MTWPSPARCECRGSDLCVLIHAARVLPSQEAGMPSAPPARVTSISELSTVAGRPRPRPYGGPRSLEAHAVPRRSPPRGRRRSCRSARRACPRSGRSMVSHPKLFAGQGARDHVSDDDTAAPRRWQAARTQDPPLHREYTIVPGPTPARTPRRGTHGEDVGE